MYVYKITNTINNSKTKESFRSIIDGGSYKHIPVYSKVKKC